MQIEYKPKALVDGYKLGREHSGKRFAAVPQKKAESGCIVVFGKEFIRTAGKTPASRLSFTDKYGRGKYWLYYYEWIPEKIW